ncbi:CHAT domain-containing protein [Sphingomonas profundi]|uniref:CHAT domain-containing protein n=1 Tax=Alterirhizorhabdus profundi TaxID=2681549 RepID=UPI0012E82E81|nr:CHAT domain-containing protein [Sphingomonas profundi]
MAADTHCKLTVGADNVRLEVAGEVFTAPVRHSDLTARVVRRMDRLVTDQKDEPGLGDKDDLALLGAVLFETLLGGQASRLVETAAFERRADPLPHPLANELLDRLNRFESEQAESTACFRITLAFSAAAGPLANYPWEIMFVADRDGPGYFLGDKATLVRTTPPPPPRIGEPRDRLDILVGWASPSPHAVLDKAQGAAATIEAKLGERIDVTVRTLEKMEWRQLGQALEDRMPDILHLILHGRHRGLESELAFHRSAEQRRLLAARAAATQEDVPVDNAEWHPIADLGAQFEPRRRPRLVFLHACDVGRSAPEAEAFRGAAMTLISAGVPFVIAMQYAISNEDAERFTTDFYRSVGEGVPVDEAVRLARRRLGRRSPAWSHRRFATPVIYACGDSTVLATPGAVRSPAPEPPPARTDRPAMPLPQLNQQACPFKEDCGGLIAMGDRHCGCERRRTYGICRAGHANRPMDAICWVPGCGRDVLVQATAAAPEPRLRNEMGKA